MRLDATASFFTGQQCILYDLQYRRTKEVLEQELHELKKQLVTLSGKIRQLFVHHECCVDYLRALKIRYKEHREEIKQLVESVTKANLDKSEYGIDVINFQTKIFNRRVDCITYFTEKLKNETPVFVKEMDDLMNQMDAKYQEIDKKEQELAVYEKLSIKDKPTKKYIVFTEEDVLNIADSMKDPEQYFLNRHTI